MKVTVTYTGTNSMLLHTGRNGDTYMFERNRPLQVFDKADIEHYRRKQATGSPFIVTPKLQPVKEPKPHKSGGVWERAIPKPKSEHKPKPKSKTVKKTTSRKKSKKINKGIP